MNKSKITNRKSGAAVSGRGYAWLCDFGLCHWAEPDMAVLRGAGKPSPEAKAVPVRIVLERAFQKLKSCKSPPPSQPLTEYQMRLARLIAANNGMASTNELGSWTGKGNLAVYSSMSSLEKKGYAHRFRVGPDRWAGLTWSLRKTNPKTKKAKI
jgi:hypothetical protein